MRFYSDRPSTNIPEDTYGSYNQFDEAYDMATEVQSFPFYNPASPLAQSIPPVPAPSSTTGIQGPPLPLTSDYIPAYLKKHIGRNIRAEFVIGDNIQTDRVGILKDVGVNYIVIRDPNSGTDVLSDLYSVKFVTIYAK